jgi:hypothetical protein
VSCGSTTACTAIGNFANRAGAFVTLAERWNGTRWAIQQTPNLAVAKSSGLDGASCASPRSCTAVGYVTSPARTNMTLAERYS